MTERTRTPSSPGRAVLGVDLGSTRLRAVYAPPGRAPRPVPPDAVDWPWPLCEPAAGGELPFAFTSVKMRLGEGRPVRFGGLAGTPEEHVARALRALRRRVDEEAGAAVGQAVISVPAWLESAQRTALLDAARSAGLTGTRLISDSLAAVIGRADDLESGTFLVYGMGYGGFELGLVRAAHGHFRALACEGTASRGGHMFDRDVLTAWARFLRRRSGPSRAAGDESAWRGMRLRAEQVKERLLTGDGGEFEELALADDPGARGWIRRRDFDAYVRPHVDWTLDRTRSLFAQSGVQLSDVDALLLVGGGTRMDLVGSGVRGLGRPCVRVPDDQLARGALLHAQRLAQSTQDDPQVGITVEDQDAQVDAPAPAVALPTVLSGPDGGRPAVPGDLAEARRLIEHGERGPAADLLRQIIATARELLDALESADTPPEHPAADPEEGAARAPSSAAVTWLDRARSLLERGRYEEAVQASHAAWARHEAPGDEPDVFEAMIEVHCAAAAAGGAVPFQDAERWLLCAHQLDPTNARIRDVLAERTYRHAVDLHGRGRRGDALAALRRVTGLNPDHAGATTLLRRLRDEGPLDIRDGPGGRTQRGHDSTK